MTARPQARASAVGTGYADRWAVPRAAGPHREACMADDGTRRSTHEDIAQLIERAWRLRHADTRQARGAAVRALGLATARDDRPGQAWATLRLALCDHILAREPEAELATLQRCIEAMRALGDRAGEAEALNLLGNALGNRGRHEQALATHAQCRALREALGDVGGVALSAGNQAIALRALGRLREARALHEDSLRLARDAGLVRAMAYAEAGLGVTALMDGDPALAVRHLELAFAAASRTEDRALECTALTRLAEARLRLGDTEAARGLLAQAQALAQRTGNVRDAGRVCLVRGLLDRAAGRHAEAAAHFDAAWREAARSHDQPLAQDVQAARDAQPA